MCQSSNMHPNPRPCWRCEAVAAAKRSERIAEEVQNMADRVEEIAKEVEDRAEKIARSMESHHNSGPTPATTIYHHYDHGQTAATETSTTIVTSTAVATSTSTLTCVHWVTSTAAATSATKAFVDAPTRPGERPLEDLLGPACWPSFWFLTVFLLIYSIFLLFLRKREDPRDPKTKASAEPKPRTSSLTQLEFDPTSLKQYITTPSRQVFAVTLCRIVTALYCLEGYWIMKTTWTMFTTTLEGLRNIPPLPIFLTLFYLVLWCTLGYGIYIVLDLSFTFVGELSLLLVSTAPSNGKKKTKNDATRGNKRAEIDGQSTGSGSEEGWQTDFRG